MKISNCRSNRSGEGLVIVIILLVIVGGGVLWLFSHKKSMDTDGRAFGHEMIQRLAVNHDGEFFRNNLGPQGRLDNPRSQQDTIISKFNELGVPAQPIAIEENMTWESHFFEPKGFFTAHLNYPAQTATLQIAISHPVGKWQLDNISFSWAKPR